MMRLVRSERLMSDDELDEDREVRQSDELDNIYKVGEAMLQRE